tara:strand:+ start:299 stop:484 length:186 start_codon:yes stop_codon:yes gene_type:complete
MKDLTDIMTPAAWLLVLLALIVLVVHAAWPPAEPVVKSSVCDAVCTRHDDLGRCIEVRVFR